MFSSIFILPVVLMDYSFYQKSKIFHYKPLEVFYKYSVKTVDMLNSSVINAYPTSQKYSKTKKNKVINSKEVLNHNFSVVLLSFSFLY